MKNYIYAALGFVAGCAVTATAAYFGVYKKYIPLNELDQEIKELTQQRKELCSQIDKITAAMDKLKKSHDDKVDKLERDIQFYEDLLEENQEEAKEQGITVKPEQHLDEDKEDEPLSEYDAEREKLGISKKTNSDGKFVIDTGNDRIDGPLTDDEQERYDECQSVGEEYTTLVDIMQERFDKTQNPNHIIYEITEEEFENRPKFIDSEELTLYSDEILARGIDPVADELENIDRGVIRKLLLGKIDIGYSRNEYLDTDYIITRDTSKWQEQYGVKSERK